MRTSSSRSFVARGRQGLALSLLLAMAAVGCFKDPNIDTTRPRACQPDNKSCPWGYVCGANGFCCVSSNGKTCDLAGPSGDVDAPTVDSSSKDTPSGETSFGTGGVTGHDGGRGPDATVAVDGVDVAEATGDSAAGAWDVPVDMPLGGTVGSGGVSGTGGRTGVGGASGTGGGGGAGSGGVPGTGGGGPGTGGAGTGGILATGGAGTGGVGTGGGGTGGQTPTCTGATKLCNGTCIPTTSCCGGCSGSTPICSNGTCVPKIIGDACDNATECASGVCADGVCCDVACGGQCESCATASSKGTCVPTTTPRTPCTTDGTVCGGACDGTAAHRKACVYPGSQTSCGPAAQCNSASNQASTAVVCSGAGACNPATTTSCAPYRCRTDGVSACATSCPSGQGVCGGACVDILSSDSHCGGACTACQGSTPKCAAGACVQCLTGTDCPSYGAGAACSVNHVCQCRPPRSTNVVKNPGLDSGFDHWTASAGALLISNDDADGCPQSASMKTKAISVSDWGSISQCVVVSASTSYYFGYKYKQEQASSIYGRVDFYAGTTCSGSALSFSTLHPGISAGTTTWLSASGTVSSPAGAGSALVRCSALGSAWGAVDQVMLDASSVSY